MFNQQELQILLGGVDAPVDLEDLRLNTKYGGLYDDHEPTIERFWKVSLLGRSCLAFVATQGAIFQVANTLDHEQRRNLLRFVTSCGRPPLL